MIEDVGEHEYIERNRRWKEGFYGLVGLVKCIKRPVEKKPPWLVLNTASTSLSPETSFAHLFHRLSTTELRIYKQFFREKTHDT